MPKNMSKGGKKFKKFKKGRGKDDNAFVYKSDIRQFYQQYAKVTKILGNGRLRAVCEDGETRLCSICGRLKKKKTNGMIVMDDIILISVRAFNSSLADVLHKYNQNDVQRFIDGEISCSDPFLRLVKNENGGTETDIVFSNAMNNADGDSSDSDE